MFNALFLILLPLQDSGLDASASPKPSIEGFRFAPVRQAGGREFSVKIERFPWHTYDFDLASLNLSLRYLEDPEGVVLLGMIDRVRGQFMAIGDVELRFEERESRQGISCRRYSIDGPGLHDRGGSLWVRIGDDPVIVDYEIDLPDEPGMTSGKLTLVGTSEMSPDQWGEHRRAKLE